MDRVYRCYKYTSDIGEPEKCDVEYIGACILVVGEDGSFTLLVSKSFGKVINILPENWEMLEHGEIRLIGKEWLYYLVPAYLSDEVPVLPRKK